MRFPAPSSITTAVGAAVKFLHDAKGGTFAIQKLPRHITVNGERDIGDGRSVERFDRNRTYAAIGYGLSERMRLQFGYMHQATDDVDKGQVQLSLHQTF